VKKTLFLPSHPYLSRKVDVVDDVDCWKIGWALVDAKALYKGNLGLLIVVLDRKHNSRFAFKGARQIIIFQICIFILCIIDLIM
jgi:hypothetical protein